MKKFFSNLKNNRYLPFIIIAVVILLLIILNVATSEHNNEYKNKKVVFNFEDTENNTVNETYNTEMGFDDSVIEDTETEFSDNSNSIEETYYPDAESDVEETDTEESDVNETDYEDLDSDLEDDTTDEPILFSSKKFLENTAKGFFDQRLKYRKYFKDKTVFETRKEIPIDNIVIKGSNLKTNEVTISCVYTDGDDDSAHKAILQFKVENNKIVDAILK